MHDRRIDSFVVLNTDLIESLIAELCKRFQAALESMNADASTGAGPHGMTTVASGSGLRGSTRSTAADAPSSLLRAAQNNAQLNQTAAPSTATETNNNSAIDAFVKIAKFVDLLISSCTPLDGASKQCVYLP